MALRSGRDRRPDGRRHGFLKGSLLAVLIIAALALCVRVALNPIATAATKKALSGMRGYVGVFKSVAVSVIPLRYMVTNLKVEEADGGRPVFFARRVEADLDWSSLLHLRPVARIDLDDAKFTVEHTGPSTKRPDLTEVSRKLRELPPLRLARLQVRDGQFLFVDEAEKHPATLWLHGIQADIDNVATRPALTKGQPTLVALSGTLQRTGQVSVFLSADPLSKLPTFAGDARVSKLQLAELGDFVSQKTGETPDQGALDLFATFKAQQGWLTGGVKVVLDHPGVKQGEHGFLDKLKTLITDTALKIFSDRVPEREGVATTIPIRGRIDSPKAELWPTVFGVLRNAFVQGVTAGFSRVPPPTAPKQQSVPTQAAHALSANGGPPLAQPRKGR